MSSVLDTIKTTWAGKIGLVNLIPDKRVFVGITNPGTPTPSICFHGQSIGAARRTSSHRYPTVIVEAIAEAEDADFLEDLVEQMRADLEVWQSTRYGALVLADLTVRIYREDEPPKRNWIAEVQMQYQTYM